MRLFTLLCFLSLSVLVNAQTTTWSAISGNNTAACSLAGSPSYCQAGFSGMSSSSSGTYNPQPANVSDVDVHTLLDGGAFTKIFTYYQGWFCMNSGSYITGNNTNCGSHVQVGYNSNNSATVRSQMDDMIRRGFDGVVFDYYGPTLTPYQMTWKYDDVAKTMAANLDARCFGPQSCPLLMTLLEDEGSWVWTNCPYNGGGTDQTACLSSKINSDLDYMRANYFGRNSYLKVDVATMQPSPQGTPVVEFFVCEECYTNPAPNWQQVWSAVRTHAQQFSPSGGPGVLLIFRDSPAFTHTQSNGGFAWVNWDYRYGADPYGLNYLKVFYDAATAAVSGNPNLVTFGAGWKGFDDTNAAWKPSPRIMQQRCGNTWLATIRKANDYYNPAKPLPYLGIATWNDYDEGTEIETGIDNCARLSASQSGSILSWNLSFSSSDGSESTIARYEVIEKSGGRASTLASLTPGSRSIDLRTLVLTRGTHTLYVRAVGQPSIQNTLSGAIQYRVR
jgi:hypothetical protein